MTKFRNLICFLSHVILLYVTISAENQTPSTTTTIPLFDVTSCKSPGTINAVKNDQVTSVLVECDNKGTDTLKTANISGENVTITGCTMNKPVKIFIFNTSDITEKAVVVKNSPSLIKETIVVCNGSNMKVQYHFNNDPLSPTAVTNIPLTSQLTMTVMHINGSTKTSSVDIEHTYKLKITGPANMYILVESCDAASDSGFTEHKVNLYVNRKPNDDYGVLNDFSKNNPAEAISTMNGFRLLDSPVVYLRCVVDVCKDVGCPSLTTTKSATTTKSTTTTKSATSTKSTTTTKSATSTTSTTTIKSATMTKTAGSRRRRRRRDVDITNRRVTLSTSFRVTRSFTTSGTNGKATGADRYLVIVSLVMAKLLFLRY